jgi:hypothetical protein
MLDTERIDERIKEWVERSVPDADVRFEPPAGTAGREGIGIFLLDLLDRQLPMGPDRAPLQLILRYLVTSVAADTAAANRTLLDLAFAAMDEPELTPEFAALDAHLWSALGVPPRPSFILHVPVQKEREQRRAAPVTEPLVVQSSAVRPYSGLVLGPGEIPVSGAYVELPSLQLSATTDARGRFRFAAVPADPPVKQLRVSARGRQFPVSVEEPDSDSEPAVIRLNLVEG